MRWATKKCFKVQSLVYTLVSDVSLSEIVTLFLFSADNSTAATMLLSNSEAKVLSMVILGTASFLVGILPACFAKRGGERKLLLSTLLCFGAGVLLATSLVHMLPEAKEGIPEYAELTVCCGFLLLYMVDEIVHLVWGDTVDVRPEEEQPSHRCLTGSFPYSMIIIKHHLFFSIIILLIYF